MKADQTTDHLSEAGSYHENAVGLPEALLHEAVDAVEKEALSDSAIPLRIRAGRAVEATAPLLATYYEDKGRKDAYRQITVDAADLAERRKDPEFRARLERSIEENRELLDRLEPKVAADQSAVAAAEEKGRSEERERLLLDEDVLDEAEAAYKSSPVGGRRALEAAMKAAIEEAKNGH